MNDNVKRILENTKYMTLATAREDGTPENVPVRFAYDDKRIYFRSPDGTSHGSNIEHNGRVALVMLDTTQAVKGAVYVRSFARRLKGMDEARAMDAFNSRFENSPIQWDKTIYFESVIGEPDEVRSVAEMYYFKNDNAIQT